MALANKPYTVRKGPGPRKAAGGYKWLIPLVAYGQYLAWKTLLVPRLQKEEDKQVGLMYSVYVCFGGGGQEEPFGGGGRGGWIDPAG